MGPDRYLINKFESIRSDHIWKKEYEESRHIENVLKNMIHEIIK